MRPIGCLTLSLLLAAPVAGQAPELGDIRFPTSGSPAARERFLVGVAWLHSFGYDDAMEEFRKAQELDPGFAMAYWGEAMANNQTIWYTQDLAAARAVLARLGPTREARLARAPSERERGYLEAVDILFGDGDKAARDRAYAAAMERLAARHPDDHEAAVLHALALLGTIPKGRQDVAIRERAGAIAAAVFRENPRHPGAAHYLIHSYDDRDHATRALEAARAYARIAPASSHALHMPAHIFLQLGMWDEAVASDEASFAASDAWVTRKGLTIASRDYHSLSWLQYEYLQQGRYRKAQEAMAPLEDAVKLGTSALDPTHHHLNAEESRDGFSVRLLASMRARYVIETRRFKDMLNQNSFDNLDELFAVGMSAAVLGDFARAEETVTLLGRQVAGVTDDIERQIADTMRLEMAGMVAIARGRTDEGLVLLRQATEAEDALPKPIGRPYPVKGAHELLGEILLGLGRYAEAAAEFRAALDRVTNHSLAVLGLARATERLGDAAGSRELYRQFLDNWRHADPDLPELAEARAAVGAAGATPPAADSEVPAAPGPAAGNAFAPSSRLVLVAGVTTLGAACAALAWRRSRHDGGRGRRARNGGRPGRSRPGLR